MDIARVKNTWAPQTLSDLDALLDGRYLGSPAKAGVNVSEQSAMRFSAVWACVLIYAQSLSWPPLKLYRARKDGGRDEARDEPLFDVLHSAANEEMPAITVKETMMSHAILSGNCYAFPTYNARGQVERLYPVPWTQIEPRRNKETRVLEYIFVDRGQKTTLPADAVFHIPGLGFDGTRGYSPIRMAMEAIGLGMAAETFASYFYSNGANIGGMLAIETGTGAKERRDELKAEIREKFQGLANSHELMIVPSGTKFERMDMPLQEAQFIETRKFQIQEIARIYRMPLHMLQDLDRATFSNIEHQDIGFIKHTMMPWFVRWEQYINAKLLSKRDRERGLFAEFNVNALLRGDSKTQAEILHIERQDGVITGNEWRAHIGMNPSDDPNSDRLLVNGNMIPIEKAGEARPQNGGAGGANNA